MHITENMARRALEKAIADNPDKKAECEYVVDDRPECIAGTALFNLGVTVDELKSIDGMTIKTVYENKRTKHTFDLGAMRVLDYAQMLQDSGATWREVGKRI